MLSGPDSYCSLSFLLIPGAADDTLAVLHLGVVLHLAFLDLFFLHHPAHNLWPQTTFCTAFPSDSWQHGGFGPTEVHFFSPSPSKSAILMPFWTEPSSLSTCHKMMSKDSRFSRKMHGNFSTRRHSCIGYVSTCFCDCDYSEGNIMCLQVFRKFGEADFTCFCVWQELPVFVFYSTWVMISWWGILCHCVYSGSAFCWCLSGGCLGTVFQSQSVPHRRHKI